MNLIPYQRLVIKIAGTEIIPCQTFFDFLYTQTPLIKRIKEYKSEKIMPTLTTKTIDKLGMRNEIKR